MAGLEDIPKGPEDVPLRKPIYDLPIVITVIDIKSKRKIREERINYGDREARLWLGRITVFAVTNGYIVQTCNEKDHVIEE